MTTGQMIREFLEANDGQSLIGSLLQYGFTSNEIKGAGIAGIIEIGDPLVYLNPPTVRELRAMDFATINTYRDKFIREANFETPQDIGYNDYMNQLGRINAIHAEKTKEWVNQ